MSGKHFLHDPDRLVAAALHSHTLTNPTLALDAAHKIVYQRLTHPARQSVSVVSGGGSGHEPSFAGMVGQGLLTAAVTGTIFASPSAEQVRVALMARVPRGHDLLVTVMNYTGDVLNFGLAVEKAQAAGLAVEMVVVGDDVGVGRSRAGKVGRRGIAGTVLVHKIAGALAARGYGLRDVARVARLVAENLVSVGASLARVHVPGRDGEAEDELGETEVEIGMGIHNEQGSAREEALLPALVDKMLAQLLDQKDEERAFLAVNSNEVVLLLNNLGGVSVLEMGGIVSEVVARLREGYGIVPVRILTGTFMTSLNGPGFSISLLNVVNTDMGGPGMIELLDYPCEATGWTAPVSKTSWEASTYDKCREDAGARLDMAASHLTMDRLTAEEMLTLALENVVAVEPRVTRFDTVVGDGDCGIGLRRGAQAILRHMSENPLSGDAAVDLAGIVPVVETEMDGTSGALYAIFLNSLLASLRSLAPGELSPEVWAEALRRSCETLSRYTPARPGDRTLVDALYPFVDTLRETGDVKIAAAAAMQAAERTRGMKACLGRTVYVGGTGFEQVPDPGAWALASFLQGLAGIKAGGTE